MSRFYGSVCMYVAPFDERALARILGQMSHFFYSMQKHGRGGEMCNEKRV